MKKSKRPYPIIGVTEIEEAKELLRTAIRSERKQNSDRQQQVSEAAITNLTLDVPSVKSASVVALYAARPHEPRTLALLDALAGQGKQVMLPVLGDGLQRDWAWYQNRDDLIQRAPGRPPEPSGDGLGQDALKLADVVLAPALAVDTAGNRLGQGGGWYDRALLHVRKEVQILALVLENEIYDHSEQPIPTEKHDQKVHGVITPELYLSLPID